MSWEPKRPSSPLLAALPWLAGLAVLFGTGFALRAERPAPAELGSLLAAGGPVEARRTAAQEKGWLADAFPMETGYLPTPPVGPLCPRGVEGVEPSRKAGVAAALAAGSDGIERLQELHKESGGWLSGLALGHLLIRAGRLEEAEGLLKKLLARNPRNYGDSVDAAVLAVRNGRPETGPPPQELDALVHLLHAAGYVQIERNVIGDDFWTTLKNPIACAKLLFLREKGSLVEKVTDGFDVAVPAPGCPGKGLAADDLYNNLIVGYLRRPTFRGTEERKAEEFARDYQDPPAKNPLLAVLRPAIEALPQTPERESWVWAVSNAEKRLRNRLLEGRGYPESPRLALTLASLMEEALDAAPDAARAALLEQQGELLAVARARREEVGGGQRAAFDQGLALLLLATASRRSGPPTLTEEVATSLEDEQHEAVALLKLAHARREDPAALAALATTEPDAELAAQLGERLGPWLSAVRQDLAAALAVRARAMGPAAATEQQRLARAAGALLAAGDPRPEELQELDRELGLGWRIRNVFTTWIGAWGTALVLAAIAWVVASWLALQLRTRKELFTSFYRLEAEQRLRSSR